jgi:hydrogenase-4 component F
MNLYPAGATVLLLGLLCITAIPPSGMFISEILVLKAMVMKGDYVYLVLTAALLCFVMYALLTRVLHIVYSQPRGSLPLPLGAGEGLSRGGAGVRLPGEKVNPWQTLSQFILFGMVIFICFVQPAPFRELINSIIGGLPK